MCGIVGKLSFHTGTSVTTDELVCMANTIKHRGVNDAGTYIDGAVGLGHRRLSIIDLSPAGHQPMHDDTGTVHIVFNGEIYNFIELRNELIADGITFASHTDTEVIIYLYKKYGYDCVKKMRGMFAFALWDATTKELFLAKDPLGKKPLKYYIDKHVCIFASELKAILSQKEVPKEIDTQAIQDYLTYGYVPAPRTGFTGIQKLKGGHYLRIKPDGGIEQTCYWDVDFSKKQTKTNREWKQTITQTLKQAVTRRLVSDVPIGAHLSGGIDSSLIVALMASTQKKPLETYSIGFAEKKYNELPYAQLVAQQYHTNHHESIIEPNNTGQIFPLLAYQYEEPLADNSVLPTWFLCKETKKDITVALNGDGGDEAFGGYYRYQAIAIYQFIRNVPLLRYIIQPCHHFFPKKHRGYKLLKYILDQPKEMYTRITELFNPLEKSLLSTDTLPPTDIYIHQQDISLLDQTFYWGIKTHLQYALIPKVDIASMAHSVEIRSPFLDQDLIELSASMPDHLKTTLFSKKRILRQIACDYIPKQCIDRPKQGFDVPLEYWFKNDLVSLCAQYITLDTCTALHIRYPYVQQLIHEHITQTHNNAKKIWAILMLCAWYNAYFIKKI